MNLQEKRPAPVCAEQQRAKRASEFSSAMNRLCEFFGRTKTEIRITELPDIEAEFAAFLAAQGYERRGIARYRWGRNALLRYARQLGWNSEAFAVADSWIAIAERTGSTPTTWAVFSTMMIYRCRQVQASFF